MANKQKIEERLQALQERRTRQRTRVIGLGVIAAVLLLLGYMFINSGSSGETELPIPTLPPVTGAVEETPTQEAANAENLKQYDSYPPMTIDPQKKYFAAVKMAKGGEFVIQLFPDKAPLTVNSFVFLARDGYFDGVTFHRVLEGFMAQGGDPTGTGAGGPGYEFANEDSDLTFDKAGVVAVANSGRDTNGSQFSSHLYRHRS